MGKVLLPLNGANAAEILVLFPVRIGVHPGPALVDLVLMDVIVAVGGLLYGQIEPVALVAVGPGVHVGQQVVRHFGQG